jgi:hypothetical protein
VEATEGGRTEDENPTGGACEFKEERGEWYRKGEKYLV